MKKFLIHLLLIYSTLAGVLQNAHAEFVEEFTSPIATRAAFIFLGGGAITYLAYQNRKEFTDKIQQDINNDKPMKKYSHYGDLLGQLAPNFVYATGALLFGETGNAKHMFDATLNAGLLTLILKYAIREKRPDSSDRLSFPSGHSATAFAFASVVGIHHDWTLTLPAYLIAAGVGFSRVNDKKHHIHDVLAGATIGIAYGYGTYFVNKPNYVFADSPIKFFPIYSPKEFGLVASYDF
jgi:membrane-associated phospholipid phosphatase